MTLFMLAINLFTEEIICFKENCLKAFASLFNEAFLLNKQQQILEKKNN